MSVETKLKRLFRRTVSTVYELFCVEARSFPQAGVVRGQDRNGPSKISS